MKARIYPSVVAKGQKELHHVLKNLSGVVGTLHLDVVDGKFAKNHSLDFPFRLSSKFKYNAHLMVRNPEKWIRKHGKKVDFYVVHFEVLRDVGKYVEETKRRKKKVALALLPETKVGEVKGYLNEVDIVLVLTVHPGFYGGRFMRGSLKKISQIKKINPGIKVMVDGGMNQKTIKEAKKAGADWFVVGSYIQKAKDKRKVVREMQS